MYLIVIGLACVGAWTVLSFVVLATWVAIEQRAVLRASLRRRWGRATARWRGSHARQVGGADRAVPVRLARARLDSIVSARPLGAGLSPLRDDHAGVGVRAASLDDRSTTPAQEPVRSR
jgi:hypothetical protein